MPDLQSVGPAATPVAHTDGPTVLSERRATQGIKLGHMRYVLGGGLALAVSAGLLLAVFFTN